jgi:hypothetical protein
VGGTKSKKDLSSLQRSDLMGEREKKKTIENKEIPCIIASASHGRLRTKVVSASNRSVPKPVTALLREWPTL